MTIGILALGLLAVLAGASGALAAPYVPADDALVLERLPEQTDPRLRELKALRQRVAQEPANLANVIPLVRRYINASRSEGDPRYLGYATAVLAPWWRNADAPEQVMVLRATIRQSTHEFDAAITDLSEVLRRNPRDAQARLTRATVLTVQGKYDLARSDCAALQGGVPPIYRTICIAAIDGLTGHGREAYATLSEALRNSPRADPVALEWGETLLGEIAHRLRDPRAAAHFQSALRLDAKDPYLVGAYADWLLDQGRAADVLPLIPADTRIDPLLLRLALAQHAIGGPDAAMTKTAMAARIDASRARGDIVHLREESRFALHLAGDPKAALALARRDWAIQKEPADLRVLAEAAVAAGDSDAREAVLRWQRDTAIEYAAIDTLLRREPAQASPAR